MGKSIITKKKSEVFFESAMRISMIFEIIFGILFLIFGNEFLFILVMVAAGFCLISGLINIYNEDKKIKEIEKELIELLRNEKGGNE